MKFSDGYWNLKKGFTLFSPAEVRDMDSSEKKLTVYAPTKKCLHRGDTLNLPMITVEYSSPMPDVIRVKIFHFKGQRRKKPEFILNTSHNTNLNIKSTDEHISLSSGKLSVNISKEHWRTEFTYNDEYITGSIGKGTGYLISDDGSTYVREQLTLDVGECVYGLGERFTPFVKNGQTVDIWNEDEEQVVNKHIRIFLSTYQIRDMACL